MHGVTITSVSLVVVTTDGVVVVDGQNDVASAGDGPEHQEDHAAAHQVRRDRIGSYRPRRRNSAFKAAYPDVVFISSPVPQQRLLKRDHPATQTVSDRRTVRLGKTDIEILNLGRAHTGGDLVAYLPESKVLFMGEIYLHYRARR